MSSLNLQHNQQTWEDSFSDYMYTVSKEERVFDNLSRKGENIVIVPAGKGTRTVTRMYRMIKHIKKLKHYLTACIALKQLKERDLNSPK